jgi:CBS domain-containing protein
MPETIRQVMTKDPVTVDATASTVDAARRMLERDLGAVIVVRDGAICGVVTDRDVVVRVVAEGRSPAETPIGDACSSELISVRPDEPLEKAVDLMRRHAVRRLPVVEHDRAVGIVSIGDLAVERDSDSALGQISAADPNR